MNQVNCHLCKTNIEVKDIYWMTSLKLCKRCCVAICEGDLEELCKVNSEEERLLMDQFKSVNKQDWNEFLEWYGKNVGNYEWNPVSVADRVNVFNRNRKLVAFKCLGFDEANTYYVDNCEYANMMKWVGVN